MASVEATLMIEDRRRHRGPTQMLRLWEGSRKRRRAFPSVSQHELRRPPYTNAEHVQI